MMLRKQPKNLSLIQTESLEISWNHLSFPSKRVYEISSSNCKTQQLDFSKLVKFNGCSCLALRRLRKPWRLCQRWCSSCSSWHMVFAALLYLVEPRDTLPTLPYAAWLVISTITTVGFGDVVPSTQSGLVLTSILMVVSSLYMAMPLAVIGHSFNTIWVNRKRILLLNKTRSRLWKWGFGPYEMRHLFGLFDLDQSDEVDLPEFQILPLRTTVERGWTGNKVKRKHANSKRQCKTMQDCIPEYSWQIP